jgi:hypothetical protein
MAKNYPIEFLTPFPATHIFKLCQVKVGTCKDLCKYDTYAMEAFIAVWLESKLGDVSHFSGRFLNFDICGYRSFLGAPGGENSTYISDEIQPDGSYKPLVVHNTWKHVLKTYGDNGLTAPQDDSYVAHPRFDTVFLRQFSTYHNTKEIQRLIDDARDAMGDTRAKELRQMADLKSASRGIYVSKSGKLPDTGGIMGIDYKEYQSVMQAISNNGLLPCGIWQGGRKQGYTYSFIAALIDAGDGKNYIHP